jgi:glycosyltransferase involved in cell wall biosynthesis
MVNSSVLEGGSNAIAEAMLVGTPVLATRVEGNVGLLGEDYDGYFNAGGADELRERLEALRGFGDAWEGLRRQVCERRQLFRRDREAELWQGLLAELI